MNNKKTGALGEALAEIMLMEKGYRILARNFCCRYGEIDIIAERGTMIAFVEVKTRLSDSFGSGAEAVTADKRQKLKRCAMCYLAMCQKYFRTVDFQVIEISGSHIPNLNF